MLFTWHEWVPVVAYMLLGSLGLFALFQFVASDQNSILAKVTMKQSLRSRLIIGLALVGTIPILALILLLSERSAHLRMERLSNTTSTSMPLVETVSCFAGMRNT
ncbi:MAG: hypothetical protein OEQ90_10270 [Gammaproteobacteria bacterium]|nr:hypothetical protein [Gammaproteobacteria bacterium]